VHTLLFSPDGKELWSFGSEVHRWRAPWNLNLPDRHERVWHSGKGFQTASFSPDRRWLAASGANRKLYLWRVRDAALIWPPLVKNTTKKSDAPKANKNPNTHNLSALVFARDGTLQGVHFPSQRAQLPFFTTWQGPVQNGTAWLAKRKTAITVESEKAAKPQWPLVAVWHQDGVITVQPNSPSGKPVLAGVNAKRRLFTLTPADKTLRFFKPTLKNKFKEPFFAFDGKTIALPMLNDQQRLELHEWNLKTAQRKHLSFFKSYWWGGLEPCVLQGKAVRVGVKAQGVTVFAEGTRQHLFDVPNLGVTSAPIAVSSQGLLAVAIPTEPASYAYVTGITKMNVAVWDLTTKKKLYVISDCNQVNDMTFSSDGKRLCIGSAQPPLGIYEARNGKVLRSAAFYRGEVNTVAFSRDGAFLRAVSQGLYQEWRLR
jgi:WD40 repeat protein